MQQWTAKAPANLALIKYAGKKNALNIPINPSLSYTLNNFVTQVKIQAIEDDKDQWRALDPKFKLSPSAIKRFLTFFKFLKKQFFISGTYLVESGNNFPDSQGVASSASSFCALTKACYQLALSKSQKPFKPLSLNTLSALSRQGSGSSCRSFFSPWALWENESARAIHLPFPKLTHQLILTDDKKKEVSSSLAHKKIFNSPCFQGRSKGESTRLYRLITAMSKKNWKLCFEIVWDEFQDLHQLYESVGIHYRNKKSLEILNDIKSRWDKDQDGPLVTMDAGSTIHLLYRKTTFKS